MNHAHALRTILDSVPELRYGFVAMSDGTVIEEVGDRNGLPYKGIVEISLRAESIVWKYEECEEYEAKDPRMVPRGVCQGLIEAIIGIPCPGFLIVMFGLRPETVVGYPDERVQWSSSFRKRVWAAVRAAYATCRPGDP